MLYPLTLSIDPKGWHIFSLRKADPAFRKFQEKVFARDNNVCQFCTFQGTGYFDVINIDGNYNNNKISNMASSCAFCTQSHFIESAGQSNEGGGTLIYAPGMSQNQLNSLCHVVFCAIKNDTGYKNSATSIYRNLKFAGRPIENTFGKGSSDPIAFAKMLIETDANVKEAEEKILKDIKF